MSALVKTIDGKTHVARYRACGPGYTHYVADAVGGDGWEYVADDVAPEDYAQPWEQRTTGYTAQEIVTHAGQQWVSTCNANVWEPGVSGWHPASAGVPEWIQPTGAHDAYAEGTVVQVAGKYWRSLMDANVWAPGVSGWRETLRSTGAPVPDWVQPAGAHDAYQIDARVTYAGQVWTSTAADNVWAPGVYGWVAD